MMHGGGGGFGSPGGWSRETTVMAGPGRGSFYGRGTDGWNDEELGQVIDPKVVRRLFPYLLEHGRLALLAFVAVLLWAALYYAQPHLIGAAIDDLKHGNGAALNRDALLL